MTATPEHPPQRRPHQQQQPGSTGKPRHGIYRQQPQPTRRPRMIGEDDGQHDGIVTNKPILIPQNQEAEEALIGAALINETVLDLCQHIKPRYFFGGESGPRGIIWGVMQGLHTAKQSVDYITVSDALRESGQLEAAGGIETLIQFGNQVQSSISHARTWADIVAKKYAARRALENNGQLAQVAYRGEFEELVSAWGLQYLEMQEIFQGLGVSLAGRVEGPRHQLLTLAEMRKRPRPEWIIPGLLHERKRILVFGDSNTGKSFVALDLGLSISALKSWHGREIRKPGAVVYVCAEGADDVMNRIDVWLREHELEDAPNFWIIEDSPNLLEMGQVAGVIERINNTLDEPPALVIFDTLAASMPGGDENTSLDMGIVIGAVHRVQRECACGVLVVHHSGKDDSKGPRGNSSLRADVDLAIKISMDAETGIIAANGDKWRSGDKRKISYGFRLINKALDNYGDLTSCILEATGKAPVTSATSASHPTASTVTASGRVSAPDRLFALMQEIRKPLRDVEWKRLFVERDLGSEKTYEAAILSLRQRHVILNVQGSWVAEGVL